MKWNQEYWANHNKRFAEVSLQSLVSHQQNVDFHQQLPLRGVSTEASSKDLDCCVIAGSPIAVLRVWGEGGSTCEMGKVQPQTRLNRPQ